MSYNHIFQLLGSDAEEALQHKCSTVLKFGKGFTDLSHCQVSYIEHDKKSFPVVSGRSTVRSLNHTPLMDSYYSPNHPIVKKCYQMVNPVMGVIILKKSKKVPFAQPKVVGVELDGSLLADKLQQNILSYYLKVA